LRRFRKTDSIEAEVTSGGRLFQRPHPEMHDHQQWTAVYVGSLAARKTTTGDGDRATVGNGDALDVVGKIPWRQAVRTSVGEHSYT